MQPDWEQREAGLTYTIQPLLRRFAASLLDRRDASVPGARKRLTPHILKLCLYHSLTFNPSQEAFVSRQRVPT